MNLVRSLSPSFSMSLAGAVLCVLVVTAPTYGQTEATAEAGSSPPQSALPGEQSQLQAAVGRRQTCARTEQPAGYTWTQLRTQFIAPVWHPEDHGPLPDIVAKGRDPNVFACGFCHRAAQARRSGKRRRHLAGLPKSYIIQQMAEYKRGARVTSISRIRLPPTLMIGLS